LIYEHIIEKSLTHITLSHQIPYLRGKGGCIQSLIFYFMFFKLTIRFNTYVYKITIRIGGFMSAGRLTLSADRDSIVLAHKLAKSEGTSISAMFVNYIKSRSQTKLAGRRLSPLAKEASGILASLPKDFDYKTEMSGILSEKYGVKQ